MTKQRVELWSKIIDNTSPQGLLYMAMRHAAYTLTSMVGRPIKVNSLQTGIVSISQLGRYVADPEMDAVGIYLMMDNDLPGQAFLTLSFDDAMYLADWLLEMRPGTTTRLSSLEYSALAEIGNVMLSSFLNSLAEFSKTALQLSPPVVRAGRLETLLEMMAMPVAAVNDELLIIKTDFVNVESALLLQLWILPDWPATAPVRSS
jgi:chemotaxis protein CheC